MPAIGHHMHVQMNVLAYPFDVCLVAPDRLLHDGERRCCQLAG